MFIVFFRFHRWPWMTPGLSKSKTPSLGYFVRGGGGRGGSCYMVLVEATIKASKVPIIGDAPEQFKSRYV